MFHRKQHDDHPGSLPGIHTETTAEVGRGDRPVNLLAAWHCSPAAKTRGGTVGA